MEWLTGRTKYEMTSMIARMGRRTSGADETQKRLRNDAPFFTKPRIVTAKNTAKASTAVTAICDVVEKEVGMRARKFANRMNRNSVKM